MARVLSPAAAQSIIAQSTDEIWICALTITHPSMESIRIVNDSVSMQRATGLYQPWAFECVLPDDDDSANPSLTLTIDNVDRNISSQLRSISGEPPKCYFEVVLVSDPDHVEIGPFDFTILEGSSDLVTLQLRLGYEEDFLNQAVPAQKYTPTNSPGLWP